MTLSAGTHAAMETPEDSVRPGINRAYEQPVFERWQARFERPGREVYDRRHAIVAELGLRAGMTVADVGAGTGLFTLLFASAVSDTGKVYAVDISPVFVDRVVGRARAAGFDHVVGVVNPPTRVDLPADSVDVAFLSDTYHHLEFPRSMLKSLRQVLKPDGRLVVIDFRKQPGIATDWVMDHVRADKQTVIQEIETSGFELEREPELLRDNYFLEFRVAPPPDASPRVQRQQ